MYYITWLETEPAQIHQMFHLNSAYFTNSTSRIPSAHMVIYAYAPVKSHPNLSGADVVMDYAFCCSDFCLLQMSLKPNQPTEGVNQ